MTFFTRVKCLCVGKCGKNLHFPGPVRDVQGTYMLNVRREDVEKTDGRKEEEERVLEVWKGQVV